MKPAKNLTRFMLLLLVFALGFAFWYAWRAFPIISGYGAKNMASALYVQGRNVEDILKEDLGTFPLSLGTYTVNEKEQSVTGTVLGLAKRKAIYRRGLGCTLVNEISEEQIRSQKFILPVPPVSNRDTIAWPHGNYTNNTIPATINKKLLQKAIDSVMDAKSGSKKGYTRAALVLYDGQVVAEQYAKGFDKNTVMLGWSISKSLTAAMIGVLVQQGKLDVNAPAPVPEWKNTDKEKITLKHLLQQTSGLNFKENYSSPSEVTNMLFKYGDMAAFAARLPLKDTPGATFNYSSGNSNVLSRIIRHVVGEEQYAAFPYTSLFYKLNMYSMKLEPDASGTYVGSSYSYATARDFARFGLLYYNNGTWNNEQILPLDWVKQTIEPATANTRKHYGYQFWLNGLDEKDLSTRWYPDVPADMFFADGYGGQNIYIIPSKKLVVVRLGLNKIDENKFLREVIQSIKS